MWSAVWWVAPSCVMTRAGPPTGCHHHQILSQGAPSGGTKLRMATRWYLCSRRGPCHRKGCQLILSFHTRGSALARECGCNPNGWWQHGGQNQLWRCGPAFGPLPWAYGPKSPSPRPSPEVAALGIGEGIVAPYAHRCGAKNWAAPPTSASTPQLCSNNFAFPDIVLEV